MYPAAVTLPNELGKAYLSRLLHLLDEFEQLAVLRLRACDDVGCATKDMVAVLGTD